MTGNRPGERTTRAAFLAIMVVMAVALSSCARSVTLGYEEAIEVMVLDGVGRTRATCVVASLDGQLDLAKVTGLDVDLDQDELDLLAETSARCAPALAAAGGVVGGPPLNEATIAAELAAAEAAVDVETEVYRMVEEGLDPTIADCLIVRLSVFPDPTEIFGDAVRLSGYIVDCRDETS